MADTPNISLQENLIDLINAGYDPKRRPLSKSSLSRYNAFDDLILLAANRTGSNPALIKAIMLKETGMKPVKNHLGYEGYAQTNEATINTINKNLGTKYSIEDMYDPYIAAEFIGNNIKYLREKQGAQDDREVIVGYNWGPANINKYRNTGRLPDETRKYIQFVDTLTNTPTANPDVEYNVKGNRTTKRDATKYVVPKVEYDINEIARQQFSEPQPTTSNFKWENTSQGLPVTPTESNSKPLIGVQPTSNPTLFTPDLSGLQQQNNYSVYNRLKTIREGNQFANGGEPEFNPQLNTAGRDATNINVLSPVQDLSIPYQEPKKTGLNDFIHNMKAAALAMRRRAIQEKYPDAKIDITNIPMGLYDKDSSTPRGATGVLFNEFTEANPNTVRYKTDFVNTPDSLLGDRKIPLSNISNFYGVENERFKVGPLEEFGDSTKIVPIRSKGLPIDSVKYNNIALSKSGRRELLREKTKLLDKRTDLNIEFKKRLKKEYPNSLVPNKHRPHIKYAPLDTLVKYYPEFETSFNTYNQEIANVNKKLHGADLELFYKGEKLPENIYNTTLTNGKFLLHSPVTKNTTFYSRNNFNNIVNDLNQYIKENKEAVPILLDNGRYRHYLYDEEGIKDPIKEYSKTDYIRKDPYIFYTKKQGENLDKYFTNTYDVGGGLNVAKQDATKVNNITPISLTDLEEYNRIQQGQPSYQQFIVNKSQAQNRDLQRQQLMSKGQTRFGNALNDLGTGILTWGTELRPPNQYELEKNRFDATKGFFGTQYDRAQSIARAGSWGLADVMTGAAMSNIGKGSRFATDFVPTNKASNVVGDFYTKVKTPTRTTPWQLEELPGLHLKSTMGRGAVPISKEGMINVPQMLAAIGKESGGAEKLNIIKKAFGDNIPQRMDYNDFRKLVQKQLIELNGKYNPDATSDYGLKRIGYYAKDHFDPKSPETDYMSPSNLLENKTVVLSNELELGRGAGVHGNPESTLGHIHYFRTPEDPNILYSQQIQSDAFQGTHSIMMKSTKNKTAEELEANSLEYMQKHLQATKDALVKYEQALNTLGLPKDSEWEMLNNIVQEQQRLVDNTSVSIKNYTQKQLLAKNYEERFIQELMDFAGKKKVFDKIRIPTAETAARVQNYNKIDLNTLKRTFKLGDDATIYDIKKSLYKELQKDPSPENHTIVKDVFKFLDEGAKGSMYVSKDETILNKYRNYPKLLKKLGVDTKEVIDNKGNTWYEFDIPKAFREGKGEIKAFSTIGAAALGAKTMTNNSNMKPNKNKYSVGGPVQIASTLGGMVKSTMQQFEPFLPRDAYGNKTLGSHMATGLANNSDKGILGMGIGALTGFLAHNKEQQAINDQRVLARSGLTTSYATGGDLFPHNSNFFPDVTRLGGSWNSYNILNQKAMGGPVNMETELARGQEVEMEHKPTLDFIKKYHKTHGRFPSAKKVAKSITIDHIKDFQKVPNPTAESYYKGLIENNLSDEVFKYALGGNIHPLLAPENELEALRRYVDGGLVEFGNGGRHEENPYGGIPVGMNPNGQPNLVEEGETRWQDYIFSDRLKVHKPMMHGLPDHLKKKTFADASKYLEKESKERPYDKISQRGRDGMMGRLMESSEMAREIDAMKNSNMYAGGGFYERFGFGMPTSLQTSPTSLPFLEGRETDNVRDLYNTLKLPLGAPRFAYPSNMEPMKRIQDMQPVVSSATEPLNMTTNPTNMVHSRQTVGDLFRNNKDLLGESLRYAPIAFNAIAGLTMRRPQNVQFGRRGEAMASRYGMQPQYVDETIGLGSVNTGYRSGINALRDASAGNAAAYRASILGSQPNYLKAREGLYSQLNALNLDQYTRAAQHNAQLGMQGTSLDANLDVMEEDINARNLGAYLSNKYGMLGEAATGLGGVGSENYWGNIAPRLYGYTQGGEHANSRKCGGRMKLMKRK